MAHAIDQTTGTAAVFVVGEPAWHRLGVVIENATTSAEAIGLAGLDWRVEQWPVRAFDPDNHSVEAGIPDTVANVRIDTKAVLGVVGKRYRVFQNHEAFDFMDGLVGDKLAMYETAGSLHGGKRVWMMASIPKEYRAGPDDLIKPYVLLTNTHDGSQALRMIPTTVRMVCQNTLNLALREAGVEGLTISHHPRLESRIAEARAKLGIIAARFDKFDDELHAMPHAGRALSRNGNGSDRQADGGIEVPKPPTSDDLKDAQLATTYTHQALGVREALLKAGPTRKRILVMILHDKVRNEALSIRLDVNSTTVNAKQRRTELVWLLATELGVEVRRYWRPDERWLSSYQKIQLAHLFGELHGPRYAKATEIMKKSDIVIALAKLFTDAAEGRLEEGLAAKVNAWLPSNLRETAQTNETEDVPANTANASAA